jgi:type II secretory pathway component GspD/PulD (secretin)
MGIRVKPRIRLVDAPIGVLTVGAWRPTVLVSKSAISGCSQEEVCMILAHEMAHLRRFDAWIGLLPQVALIAFYFHPAVWLACREFGLSREAVCDEDSISALRIDPDLYGDLLLRLGDRSGASLCTPGVSSHFRLLRRRITMLGNASRDKGRRGRRRPIELICAAVVLSVALITPVEGRSQAQAPSKPVAALAALRTSSTTTSKAKKKVRRAKAVANAGPVTSVFALRATKGPETAGLLRQIFRGSDAAIVTDPRSNAIIVRAAPETTRQVADTIRLIDSLPRSEDSPNDSFELKCVPLTYARASDVARIVHEHSGLRVSVDDRTNSIVLSAPHERMQRLVDLISHLDVQGRAAVLPPSATNELRCLQLTYAPALDVARILQVTFGTGEVRISSDQRTNAVIVSGSASALDRINHLVSELDKPNNEPITSVFPLKYASANEVAEVVAKAAKGTGLTSVVPDVQVNSIIVVATPEKTNVIRQLLVRLDVRK